LNMFLNHRQEPGNPLHLLFHMFNINGNAEIEVTFFDLCFPGFIGIFDNQLIHCLFRLI